MFLKKFKIWITRTYEHDDGSIGEETLFFEILCTDYLFADDYADSLIGTMPSSRGGIEFQYKSIVEEVELGVKPK